MSVIFITGATSGIGRATAERFAGCGWHVVATGRRADRLATLKDSFPKRIHTLNVDVTDSEAMLAGIESLPALFADIDVLLNNAGLALGVCPAQEASLADWNRMVDTNIKALMTVTHMIMPGMVARKKGHIVNLGSIAGSYAYPGGNVYCATKAFVEQFTRCLRCDLHGTGVRVTNIEPGLLETEFTTVRFHGDADASKKIYESANPLVPEDIAECVHWTVNAPAHVNITSIEVMPTTQSHGGMRCHKGE